MEWLKTQLENHPRIATSVGVVGLIGWGLELINNIFAFNAQILPSVTSGTTALPITQRLPAIVGFSCLLAFAIWILSTVFRQSQLQRRIRKALVNLHNVDLKLSMKVEKQYCELFTTDDFRELCKDMTVRLQPFYPEQNKAIAEIKKKTRLSKKPDKRRQQIDDIFQKLEEAGKSVHSLDKCLAHSRLLDNLPAVANPKFKGIIMRRGQDRKWQRLFGDVNKIKLNFSEVFTDKDLNALVDKYMKYSLCIASLQLDAHLYNRFVTAENQPTGYIISGAYSPESALKTAMTELLKQIDVRIKTVQKELRNKPSVSVGHKEGSQTE